MKKMMERFKNERGLTLVELLAVVVILAIIGTIAFVLIGNIIENSKKDAHVANAQQLISATKLHEADTGKEITSLTSGELEESGLLEPLTNPWDPTDEDYEGTVEKDGSTYKVTITGKDGTIKECDLTKVPENVILQGRDEACKYEPTDP